MLKFKPKLMNNNLIIKVFFLLSVLFTSYACNKNTGDKADAATIGTDSTGLNIVYVDIDTLLSRYDLYQQRKKELEDQSKIAETALAGKIEAFQKRVARFQQDIAETQQRANNLAPVELKKLEEKFAAQQQNLGREEESLMQQRETVASELDNKLMTALNELQKNIDDYLSKFATEKGYDLVLKKGNNGSVMYGHKGLDITDEVAKGLNEGGKDKK